MLTRPVVPNLSKTNMTSINVPNNTQLKLNNNASTKRAKQTYVYIEEQIINAVTDTHWKQANECRFQTAYNEL